MLCGARPCTGPTPGAVPFCAANTVRIECPQRENFPLSTLEYPSSTPRVPLIRILEYLVRVHVRLQRIELRLQRADASLRCGPMVPSSTLEYR
jgi:hypothetical protein